MTSYVDIALLPFYVSEVASYLSLGGMGYLAWRLVRAYERRGVELDRLDDLAQRLDAVEGQIRQTAEAQQFTTALLVGRMPAGAGERLPDAHASFGNSVSNGMPHAPAGPL